MSKSKYEYYLAIGAALLIMLAAGSIGIASSQRDRQILSIQQNPPQISQQIDGVFWHVLSNPETKCLLNPLINPDLVTIPDNSTGCLAPAFSGTKVWWFGEDTRGSFLGITAPLPQPAKNGGTSTSVLSGNLTSPSFSSTPNGSKLEFRSWWEIESVNPQSFDIMSILASSDGVSFTEIAKLNPTTDPNWTADRAPLHYASGYSNIGEPAVNPDPFLVPNWTNYVINLPVGTTKIRFSFNSRDRLFNGFRGWMLDNISVLDVNNSTIFSDNVEGGPDNWVAEPTLPPIVDINIMKFNDSNGNGFLDGGEAKLLGWNFTVQDNTSNTVCAGSTDANGSLSCPAINTSLNPPPYTITEVLKPGWINTTPNPRRIFPLFTPVNISFGNAMPGEIHGLKWDDKNGNGIKDVSEPGVANVSICYVRRGLFDGVGAAQFGEVCTLTNGSGNYWFMNLTPGFYTVFEILPPGKAQTFPLFGNPHFISLNSSEIKEGIDFGNANASEIRGMKFNDSNGNGIRDIGESGVPGVGIRLTRMISPGNEFVAGFNNTDISGNYSFTNLVPGFYRVEEFPTGRAQTFPANGSPYFINLSAGVVMENVDFGNQPVPPGEIRGTKFNDSNGNGVQDAGELGIPGVTICITSAWTCTTTDIFGNYDFPNVPVGTYTVYEILPSGRAATTPRMVIVTVNSSEVKVVNFGNRLLTPPPSDVSVDQQYGQQNGVPTVLRPGLTVLTIRKNLTNISDNVTAVNLTLKWSDGTTKTANMVEIDDTNVWVANFSAPFPPGTAQMTFKVDVAPAGPGPEDAIQIGDIIFIDPSGQIRNACTGAPVSGANATLLVEFPPTTGNFIVSPPANQIPPTNPQTTGADGRYSWLTVPGTYKVRAEKTGFVTAESPPVSVPPPVFNLDISLTPNGGCLLGATIKGTKFNDTNGNGRQDPGEAGLANWTIRLLGFDIRDNKAVSVTAVTDPNGNYSFTNLTPGFYTVSEGNKPGFMATTLPARTVRIIANETVIVNFGNKKIR